jgi:hypothetical protein
MQVGSLSSPPLLLGMIYIHAGYSEAGWVSARRRVYVAVWFSFCVASDRQKLKLKPNA